MIITESEVKRAIVLAKKILFFAETKYLQVINVVNK